MARKASEKWLTEEVAELLASCPSREVLLAYRPSERVMQRHNALLEKCKGGLLTPDEELVLDQFEHVEMLMQSVKARLRVPRPVRA